MTIEHAFDIPFVAALALKEKQIQQNYRPIIAAYDSAAADLTATLAAEIDGLYRTDCPHYGDTECSVKYFLWVKEIDCAACGQPFDLFPGYLLAEATRHPRNVLVCPGCGDLNEVDDVKHPGTCRTCGVRLQLAGPAKRSRCNCPHCGHPNTYPRPAAGPPRHRLFAIEYYNPARKAAHTGRFFKRPDGRDLARVANAAARLTALNPTLIPEDAIPRGDETDRLHRWGYRYYHELFNQRQLLALELSARLIAANPDERLRQALATNLSDLLRYQNMLCRYDAMALKSLDIFSVHGFPVGLIQCESNILGIRNGNGAGVGSGGWVNIIDKYRKAKAYCDAPFEVRQVGTRKTLVPIAGEWIGEERPGAARRSIRLRCASATDLDLPPASLDAVFTDPPYFGNVQYAELMDFCYVWLRRLVGSTPEGFGRPSTRSADELTGNITEDRGLTHFAEGLAAVFGRMARALKPGAPLAFTYHHNRIEAYHAVGVAILDAGLNCSASLPCPAEMSGSIHIHGTGSSIVDTVLVCRTTGSSRRGWLFETPVELASVVAADLAMLSAAGRVPTAGDTRCIVFGHLTRMGVWRLRPDWDPDRPMRDKVACFAECLMRLGSLDDVMRLLATRKVAEAAAPAYTLTCSTTLEASDAVPF